MTRLKLVKPPPPAPEPIEIRALIREEARARDWSRVHIEADRRPPVVLRIQRWGWSSPINWRK